jgi:hypothetical protein
MNKLTALAAAAIDLADTDGAGRAEDVVAKVS